MHIFLYFLGDRQVTLNQADAAKSRDILAAEAQKRYEYLVAEGTYLYSSMLNNLLCIFVDGLINF